MKGGKIAGFLVFVLFGLAFVSLIPATPVYAVDNVILNPTRGPVGTRVSVTAWIANPGGRYNISFATGADGADLGVIKSGNAPVGSTVVNDYFIVPSCFSKMGGFPHVVQVQDESRRTSTRSVNFTVDPSLTMSVPASVRVGDRVPINITITGGYPSTIYSFDVSLLSRLTGQTLVRLSTLQSSDGLGSLPYMLYYPDSFVGTSQVGNYTVQARIVSSLGFGPISSYPAGPAETTNVTLQQSFQISALPNRPPTAQIISIAPNPADVGQQVTFTGNGTDPDGTIIGYNWTSSIDKSLSTSRAFSRSDLSEGTHIIYLRVQDNGGIWSNAVSTSLIVRRGPSQIPNAIIDSILPNLAKTGQQVTFTGHGIDFDGFVIGYRWTSSIDGWLSDASSFSMSSLSVGDHTIWFEVQDNSDSWSAPFSASLTVEPERTGPTAVIDSALPSSIAAGQTLEFAGHGEDPSGVIMSYRWVSSIDGLLSTSAEFSTSGLSKGTHRITFQVQNGEGLWSDEIEVMVDVVEPTSLFWLLPVVGCLAAATGAFSFVHISRPPSSTEVKNDLHEKEEKEKKKREKEKQKSYLSIETDSPKMIMGATFNEATIKVRNIGLNEIKDVAVSADATDGLVLEEKGKPTFSMKPNDERSLVFHFKTSENLRKGVYTLSFVVRSRDTPKQTWNCYSRAVKIGLLSNAGRQEYAEPLRLWLKEKSYTFDELRSADNLVKSLLKYDLVILAPEMELRDQWMHNLFSFVENSQSLLVTDKVTTSEDKLLADILGYSEMHYQKLKLHERLLVVSPNQLIIPYELEGGEKIHVEKLWGNVCVSKLSTGKDLTDICRENEETTTKIPGLVINQFMEGKTAHLNFHAEESLTQISSVLEKTLDWLLSVDVSIQPKPWSSGLLSLKLARATLSELLRKPPPNTYKPS